jgi:hypothetical protein
MKQDKRRKIKPMMGMSGPSIRFWRVWGKKFHPNKDSEFHSEYHELHKHEKNEAGDDGEDFVVNAPKELKEDSGPSSNG